MDNSRIESVSQYLEVVERTRTEWGIVDGDQEPLWFRGMQSEVRTLEPKLLREVKLYCDEPETCEDTADCKGNCGATIQRAEDRLVTLFKNRGRIQISQAEAIMIRGVESRNADLHYMFRIQHYGGDTRLLDWTANPLNGLYFALRYNENVYVKFTKPSVWVLAPRHLLNKQAKMTSIIEELKNPPKEELETTEEEIKKVRLDAIPTADDILVTTFLRRDVTPLIQTAKARKLSDHLEVIKYPIPLMPALDEERIRSQQGRFTLHLKVPGWHPERGIFKTLRRVEVNAEKRDSLLRELNRIGINEFSLFPDLEGLARHCRRDRLIWPTAEELEERRDRRIRLMKEMNKTIEEACKQRI